jgi:hypothetical protein
MSRVGCDTLHRINPDNTRFYITYIIGLELSCLLNPNRTDLGVLGLMTTARLYGLFSDRTAVAAFGLSMTAR